MYSRGLYSVNSDPNKKQIHSTSRYSVQQGQFSVNTDPDKKTDTRKVQCTAGDCKAQIQNLIETDTK